MKRLLKKIKLMHTVYFLLVLTSCVFALAPSTQINIKVVDENNIFISNAKIRVGLAGLYLKDKLFTNTNGERTFNGSTRIPYDAGIEVTKDGYYRSSVPVNLISLNKLLNRWEPYPCELKVILKKKKNPVPMYAKWTGWIKIPEIDKKIGYDLEIGDWVHPHGKGKISDFYLLSYLIVDDLVKDYVKIFFENNDGIIEISQDEQINDSVFKIQHQAPVDDYKNELLLGETHNKIPASGLTYDGRKKESQFILRTRTKFDENNNLISANYTVLKNYNGSSYSIRFTYYFNPDNQSRSLEFNGENLFNKKDKLENNKK